MKVDGFAVYHPCGTSAFEPDSNDDSFGMIEECGVDFFDSGKLLPYVKSEKGTTVFVGFPFHTGGQEQGGRDLSTLPKRQEARNDAL